MDYSNNKLFRSREHLQGSLGKSYQVKMWRAHGVLPKETVLKTISLRLCRLCNWIIALFLI